jgi:hypothetical protein
MSTPKELIESFGNGSHAEIATAIYAHLVNNPGTNAPELIASVIVAERETRTQPGACPDSNAPPDAPPKTKTLVYPKHPPDVMPVGSVVEIGGNAYEVLSWDRNITPVYEDCHQFDSAHIRYYRLVDGIDLRPID